MRLRTLLPALLLLLAAPPLAMPAGAQQQGQDWFIPGSFAVLSAAEALSRPSFERLDAGLALGLAADHSAGVDHSFTVIEIRLPEPPRVGAAITFPAVTLDAVVSRSDGRGVRTRAPRVSVGDETIVVRGSDGQVVATARSQSEAFQRARAVEGHALPESDVVALAGV